MAGITLINASHFSRFTFAISDGFECWFFEIRELIGNRPSQVLVGVGNSLEDVHISVLETGEGEEEIRDGKADGGFSVELSEPEVTVLNGDDDVVGEGEDGVEPEVDELRDQSGDEGKGDDVNEKVLAEIDSMMEECEKMDAKLAMKGKASDIQGTKGKSEKGSKKTGPAIAVSKPSQAESMGKGSKLAGPADRFADVAVKEEETHQQIIELCKAKALAHAEATKQRTQHRAMQKKKGLKLCSQEHIRKMELGHEFQLEELRLQMLMGQQMGNQNAQMNSFGYPPNVPTNQPWTPGFGPLNTNIPIQAWNPSSTANSPPTMSQSSWSSPTQSSSSSVLNDPLVGDTSVHSTIDKEEF
ncbi:hypothetical protein PQX77_013958 [Marasmius sp. AFHP31]|nr:hypothetical protein PQX77_013958 [Marasmius sp. AFHP31]